MPETNTPMKANANQQKQDRALFGFPMCVYYAERANNDLKINCCVINRLIPNSLDPAECTRENLKKHALPCWLHLCGTKDPDGRKLVKKLAALHVDLCKSLDSAWDGSAGKPDYLRIGLCLYNAAKELLEYFPQKDSPRAKTGRTRQQRCVLSPVVTGCPVIDSLFFFRRKALFPLPELFLADEKRNEESANHIEFFYRELCLYMVNYLKTVTMNQKTNMDSIVPGMPDSFRNLPDLFKDTVKSCVEKQFKLLPVDKRGDLTNPTKITVAIRDNSSFRIVMNSFLRGKLKEIEQQEAPASPENYKNPPKTELCEQLKTLDHLDISEGFTFLCQKNSDLGTNNLCFMRFVSSKEFDESQADYNIILRPFIGSSMRDRQKNSSPNTDSRPIKHLYYFNDSGEKNDYQRKKRKENPNFRFHESPIILAEKGKNLRSCLIENQENITKFPSEFFQYVNDCWDSKHNVKQLIQLPEGAQNICDYIVDCALNALVNNNDTNELKKHFSIDTIREQIEHFASLGSFKLPESKSPLPEHFSKAEVCQPRHRTCHRKNNGKTSKEKRINEGYINAGRIMALILAIYEFLRYQKDSSREEISAEVSLIERQIKKLRELEYDTLSMSEEFYRGVQWGFYKDLKTYVTNRLRKLDTKYIKPEPQTETSESEE